MAWAVMLNDCNRTPGANAKIHAKNRQCRDGLEQVGSFSGSLAEDMMHSTGKELVLLIVEESIQIQKT